jgi:hypothetical protein
LILSAGGWRIWDGGHEYPCGVDAAAFFFNIRDWMQSNALTFHHILARLPGPPVCLISDMFLGFTQVPPHLSSHVSSFHLWVSKWGEWLRE